MDPRRLLHALAPEAAIAADTTALARLQPTVQLDLNYIGEHPLPDGNYVGEVPAHRDLRPPQYSEPNQPRYEWDYDVDRGEMLLRALGARGTGGLF